MSKSDMSSAFRQVPLKGECWKFLMIKATHPVTGLTFVDKCLPFGSSIIFQEVSNAIVFIVQFQNKQAKPELSG